MQEGVKASLYAVAQDLVVLADRDDAERAQHVVLLFDRDVLAGNEGVPLEAEAALVVARVAMNIVVERPHPAGLVNEVASSWTQSPSGVQRRRGWQRELPRTAVHVCRL